jgi:hypothetical protein
MDGRGGRPRGMAAGDGREAKAGIAQWVAFYNIGRPLLALEQHADSAYSGMRTGLPDL